MIHPLCAGVARPPPAGFSRIVEARHTSAPTSQCPDVVRPAKVRGKVDVWDPSARCRFPLSRRYLVWVEEGDATTLRSHPLAHPRPSAWVALSATWYLPRPGRPVPGTLYTIHAAATPHSEVAAVQEQTPRTNQRRYAFLSYHLGFASFLTSVPMSVAEAERQVLLLRL